MNTNSVSNYTHERVTYAKPSQKYANQKFAQSLVNKKANEFEDELAAWKNESEPSRESVGEVLETMEIAERSQSSTLPWVWVAPVSMLCSGILLVAAMSNGERSMVAEFGSTVGVMAIYLGPAYVMWAWCIYRLRNRTRDRIKAVKEAFGLPND